MQLRNRLHLWGASILSFYLFVLKTEFVVLQYYEAANCGIADTKKWLHGASTHWRTHARIRRPVSIACCWWIFMWTLIWGKFSLWCASWKECILPFSSRCQDYTWSLNPQNRHCYKVCHLENFWSTQQITHLVGRATTHTATRQTITGFLLRWHESFARFRYFLVYHSLARPNPSHPWHWDCSPIVRMFSPEINWRGPGQPGWQWGGWFCKISIWCLANFRFLFDVWQTWVHSVKHIWRLLRFLLDEFHVSCPEMHKWPCSIFEQWPKDQKWHMVINVKSSWQGEQIWTLSLKK